MPNPTRSPSTPPADSETGLSRSELARLKISREVAYYLHSRGIPYPTCPPAIKTPEPGQVERRARFDPARVDRVIAAFNALRHTKGEWAGRPLRPDPWEIAYVLAPVFGWVHRNEAGDYVRVIRDVYVDVPRRNGKSTLSGGIAVYLTAADGEPGAEVVAAATTVRQAGFVFQPVKALAVSAPKLRGHVEARQSRIIHRASGSYFEVISSAADAQHGANLHGVVIDELHIHRTADLVDALETGTGSRRQPLVVKITTADDGRPNTVYARNRDRVEQLARRVFVHPSTYGVVFAAEPTDDPFVESTWRKANPGYGISPTREYLRSEASKAEQSPAELAKFLRLHLGLRTKQQTKFIDLPVWDRNASIVDEVALRGRECYGGLDLANTSDLCALCWDFPSPDGSHDVLWRFWLPERGFQRLDRRLAGAAEVWRKRGLITVTAGDVTDYDFIRAQVNADRERFDVREIAYDPWNASQLINDLVADGAPAAQVRQGFASLSGPTKHLLHLLLEGSEESPRYRHGGNPVMRWMIDNLAVASDPAGNVKPNKATSGDKIDGISAAVMALDRVIHRVAPRVSAYEANGLEVV
jgi:phage terminase large subunit-like protein